MTQSELIDWLVGYEVPPEIMARPLAVNAWEKALESTHLPDNQFRGVVYCFKSYSSPHLDNLDLTPGSQ